MSATQVNLKKLEQDFDQLITKGVKYGLGSKARLDAKPNSISKIDCSGYVRWALYNATGGKLTIPDGSWHQRVWCEKNLVEVPYSKAMYPKDGELYIAFITAGVNGAGSVGHVWFVKQRDADAIGETLESHGGRGINSRNANYGVLARQVHKCFKLPTTAGEVAAKPVAATSESKLILDGGKPLDMTVIGGSVYVKLADVLNQYGKKTFKATNKLNESPPRFYVTSTEL